MEYMDRIESLDDSPKYPPSDSAHGVLTVPGRFRNQIAGVQLAVPGQFEIEFTDTLDVEIGFSHWLNPTNGSCIENLVGN